MEKKSFWQICIFVWKRSVQVLQVKYNEQQSRNQAEEIFRIFIFPRLYSKRPTALLTLTNTLLRSSPDVNLKSDMTPGCFWENVWETYLLLKDKGGWVVLLDLQLRITLWACLLGPGLKLILHWKVHSLTFFRSLFNSFVEKITSWTTENNNVSSPKKFALKVKLSDKSFI